MGDDLATLWRAHDGRDDVCCEIVQIAEGEFELRLLRNGRLWLSSESSDYHDLLDRALALHAELTTGSRLVESNRSRANL